MAYAFGSAANANELLDAVRLFLIDNGWTVNSWTDDNTTYRTPAVTPPSSGKRLHVSKTDAYGQTMYFNLRSAYGHAVFGNSDDTSLYAGKYGFELHGIGINGSTGYDAGQPWDIQPGYCAWSEGQSYGGCLYSSGVVNYWINQIGDTVNIIVEDGLDRYSYISFGSVNKAGAGLYAGGQFYSASFNSFQPWQCVYDTSYRGVSYHFSYKGNSSTETTTDYSTSAIYIVGLDGITGWISPSRFMGGVYISPASVLCLGFSAVSPNTSYTYNARFGRLSGIAIQGSPNNLASVSPMFPIYAFSLHRTNVVLRMLGSVDGIRHLAMDSISTKSTFTFGGDTWKCFTARSRNVAFPLGIPGFAILIS